MYWQQRGRQYKPKPEIIDCNHLEYAFLQHFSTLIDNYSSVIIVDLLDQKGAEQPLSDLYQNLVKKYGGNRMTYVGFDFHAVCSNMKFENVSLLLNILKSISMFNSIG